MMRIFFAVAFSVAVLVGLYLFFGKSHRPSVVNTQFNEFLTKATTQAAEGEVIELAEARSGAWEKLYLYPPYTTDRILQMNHPDIPSDVLALRIGARDDIWLAVFVEKQVIVNAAAVPRALADFPGTGGVIEVRPSTARFQVSRAGGRLVLSPASTH
jgi:hypothetical protein